jgi:hypothetical protein
VAAAAAAALRGADLITRVGGDDVVCVTQLFRCILCSLLLLCVVLVWLAVGGWDAWTASVAAAVVLARKSGAAI